MLKSCSAATSRPVRANDLERATKMARARWSRTTACLLRLGRIRRSASRTTKCSWAATTATRRITRADTAQPHRRGGRAPHEGGARHAPYEILSSSAPTRWIRMASKCCLIARRSMARHVRHCSTTSGQSTLSRSRPRKPKAATRSLQRTSLHPWRLNRRAWQASPPTHPTRRQPQRNRMVPMGIPALSQAANSNGFTRPGLKAWGASFIRRKR